MLSQHSTKTGRWMWQDSNCQNTDPANAKSVILSVNSQSAKTCWVNNST